MKFVYVRQRKNLCYFIYSWQVLLGKTNSLIERYIIPILLAWNLFILPCFALLDLQILGREQSFAIYSLKRYEEIGERLFLRQRGANSHKHIDARKMRREFESFECSEREGKVGCASRDGQLRKAGYCFLDTANFTTTTRRSDKNAKSQWTDERCSLSPSFLLYSPLSHSSFAPLHYTGSMTMACAKLRNWGSAACKIVSWLGSKKNSRFLQTAFERQRWLQSQLQIPAHY